MRRLIEQMPGGDVRATNGTAFYLACLLGVWLRVASKPVLLRSGWSLGFTLCCSLLVLLAWLHSFRRRMHRYSSGGDSR